MKLKTKKFLFGGETLLEDNSALIPRLPKPENAPAVESNEHPGSFLGSDYVHNFIKNNKESMDYDGDLNRNTPANKINDAYYRQLLNGKTKVYAKDISILKNTQDKNNIKSYNYFKHEGTTIPEYFPNRPSTSIMTNVVNGDNVNESTYFKTWVPSLGWVEEKY